MDPGTIGMVMDLIRRLWPAMATDGEGWASEVTDELARRLKRSSVGFDQMRAALVDLKARSRGKYPVPADVFGAVSRLSNDHANKPENRKEFPPPDQSMLDAQYALRRDTAKMKELASRWRESDWCARHNLAFVVDHAVLLDANTEHGQEFLRWATWELNPERKAEFRAWAKRYKMGGAV